MAATSEGQLFMFGEREMAPTQRAQDLDENLLEINFSTSLLYDHEGKRMQKQKVQDLSCHRINAQGLDLLTCGLNLGGKTN
jgi:hypothetical protein